MPEHLVFLVSSFEPDVGGDVRLTANQARALVQRGWKVTVLTRAPDRSCPREEHRDGLTIVRRGHRLGDRADTLRALIGWTRWLLSRRSTVTSVHVVMHPDYLLPVAAAGMLRRSLLQWITDGDVERSLDRGTGALRIVQRELRRWLVRHTVNVSLTSRMAAELDSVWVPQGEVIPLGIDINRHRPPSGDDRRTARAEQGLLAEEVVILFIGHLVPRKGVDRLIRAAGELPSELPWRLWLLGDDWTPGRSHRHMLERLVGELQIEARVDFKGNVQDVTPHLRAADIFAIASKREGLPNVLLEAMAYGLPCVAPASAGGDVLLGPGGGTVPDTNDPADVAAALLPLIEDDVLRRRMGSVARETVSDYELDPLAARYEELYRRSGRVVG